MFKIQSFISVLGQAELMQWEDNDAMVVGYVTMESCVVTCQAVLAWNALS